MNETSCVFHDECKKRLLKSEENVDELYDKVNELEKNTALDSQKFTMVLENLSKLPEAMLDIKDSLILMKDEIKSSGDKTALLETKVDELNTQVCVINSENSFNIRLWVKDNFVAIILGVSGLGAWVSTIYQSK